MELVETFNDIRLVARAVKERWPVPAERRGEIIDSLVEIATDRNREDGHRISAAKALITADGLNQKDEHNTANNANRSRFLEVAERLGLGSHFAGPPGIGTVVDSQSVVRTAKRTRKRPVKKKGTVKRGGGSKSSGNRKPKKKGKVSKRS